MTSDKMQLLVITIHVIDLQKMVNSTIDDFQGVHFPQKTGV